MRRRCNCECVYTQICCARLFVSSGGARDKGCHDGVCVMGREQVGTTALGRVASSGDKEDQAPSEQDGMRAV